MLKIFCFPLIFLIGDFRSCFGDVELFVLEFSSMEFSWSSELPSSDDDFFGSFGIFEVDSLRIARIRSTDRDFLNADFMADDLIFFPSVEYAMLLTELVLLLIDGRVG